MLIKLILHFKKLALSKISKNQHPTFQYSLAIEGMNNNNFKVEEETPFTLHRRSEDDDRPRRRSSSDRPSRRSSSSRSTRSTSGRRSSLSPADRSGRRPNIKFDEIDVDDDFDSLAPGARSPMKAANKKADEVLKEFNKEGTGTFKIKKKKYVLGTSQEEAKAYIDSTFAASETDGIVSRKLKFVGGVIFGIILVILIVGTYLNNNNPLLFLLETAEQPFSIEVKDANSARIVSYTNTTENNLPISSASEDLFSSLIAMHGVLEVKSAEKNNIMLLTQDNAPLPNFNQVSMSAMNTPAVEEEVGAEGQTEETEAEGDVVETEEVLPEAAPEEASADAVEKENIGCFIYQNIDDFSTSACSYSYPKFLVDYMVSESQHTQTFVTKLIQASPLLEDFLLLRWVQNNIDSEKYFSIYLSNMNFGDYIIGVNSASINYFNVPISSLTIPQSVFLAKLMYDNTRQIYVDDIEVSTLDILHMLAYNNIISYDDIQAYEEEIQTYAPREENSPINQYLSEIFNEGYKLYNDDTIAEINTTFLNSIGNTAISLVKSAMKGSDIPNGAAMVIKDNNLLASFNIGQREVDGNVEDVFYEHFPYTKTFTTLKPILYTIALDRGFETSNLLLENDYQNLINTYHNKYLYNTNIDIEDSEASTDNSSIEVISRTNFDIAPDSLRELFAERLSKLESEYLAQITAPEYIRSIRSMGISVLNQDVSFGQMLKGETLLNFEDLVSFFAAHLDARKGIMENFNYYDNINFEEHSVELVETAELNPSFLNILKNISFYKHVLQGPTPVTYHYVLDYHVGIAFTNNSLIAVWLGDNDNPNLQEDYSEELQSVIASLTRIVQ